MLRHIVLLSLKHVSKENENKILDRLNDVSTQIPQIEAIAFGKHQGKSPSSYDFAITVDFRSEQDYLAYAQHPIHQALAILILESVCDIAQIQFQSERLAI